MIRCRPDEEGRTPCFVGMPKMGPLTPLGTYIPSGITNLQSQSVPEAGRLSPPGLTPDGKESCFEKPNQIGEGS